MLYLKVLFDPEETAFEDISGGNSPYTRNTLTPDCGLDDGLADRESEDSGLGSKIASQSGISRHRNGFGPGKDGLRA